MTFFAAITPEGETRFIDEVPRGSACGCICPVCLSPLVAKQGAIKDWGFAHIADQERPDCKPGALNLLRHLAIRELLKNPELDIPTYRNRQVHYELWEPYELRYPPGTTTTVADRPALDHWVALVNIPCTPPAPPLQVGLWVQIGKAMPRLANELKLQGQLVYRFDTPLVGTIRSEADALAHLSKTGILRWLVPPDINGQRAAALRRLERRVNEKAAQEQALLQANRDRLQQARYGGNRNDPLLAHHQTEIPAPVNPYAPAQHDASPLPEWASEVKPKTAIFGFRLRQDATTWVVFTNIEGDICTVPAMGAFEGWDEALPASIGIADNYRGWYRAHHQDINQVTNTFYRLGTKSHVASELASVYRFFKDQE